jgi:hypothetical protein
MWRGRIDVSHDRIASRDWRRKSEMKNRDCREAGGQVGRE